jgi:hypothetical protein
MWERVVAAPTLPHVLSPVDRGEAEGAPVAALVWMGSTPRPRPPTGGINDRLYSDL